MLVGVLFLNFFSNRKCFFPRQVSIDLKSWGTYARKCRALILVLRICIGSVLVHRKGWVPIVLRFLFFTNEFFKKIKDDLC